MTCKQSKSRKILAECQLEMINEKHVTIPQCVLQEIAVLSSQNLTFSLICWERYGLNLQLSLCFLIVLYVWNFWCLRLLKKLFAALFCPVLGGFTPELPAGTDWGW